MMKRCAFCVTILNYSPSAPAKTDRTNETALFLVGSPLTQLLQYIVHSQFARKLYRYNWSPVSSKQTVVPLIRLPDASARTSSFLHHRFRCLPDVTANHHRLFSKGVAAVSFSLFALSVSFATHAKKSSASKFRTEGLPFRGRL